MKVDGNPFPFAVHLGEVLLAISVSGIRGPSIPPCRFGEVLWHQTACEVNQSQAGLRTGIALSG
jgi:hypothetical protein